jgi:hypothetical protein
MRNRPLLTTTIDPDMHALLRRVADEDQRPLSFVVDEALRVWAVTLAPEKETS